MNMKKIALAGALLVAGLVGKANALITVSTASVAGVQAVAAPSTGKTTKLKGCVLGNDTGSAACVFLKSGTTTKLVLCAGANSSATYPPAVPSATFGSGTNGGFTSLFGEDMVFSGAFNVTSSSPSSSIVLTCASITN